MPRNKKNKGGGGGSNAAAPKLSSNNPIPLRAPETPAAVLATAAEDNETLKTRLAEAKDRLTRVEAVIETIGVQRQSTDAAIAEAAQKLQSIGAIVESNVAVPEAPSQSVTAEPNTGTAKKNKKHNKHKVHNLIPPEGFPVVAAQKLEVQPMKPTQAAEPLPIEAEQVGEKVDNQGSKNKKKNKNKNKQQQNEEAAVISPVEEAISVAKVIDSETLPSKPSSDIAPTPPTVPTALSKEETPPSGDGKKKKNKNKNKNKQNKDELSEGEHEKTTESEVKKMGDKPLEAVTPSVDLGKGAIIVATAILSPSTIDADRKDTSELKNKPKDNIPELAPNADNTEAITSKKKNKNKQTKNEPIKQDTVPAPVDNVQKPNIKQPEPLPIIQECPLQSPKLVQSVKPTETILEEPQIIALADKLEQHQPSVIPKPQDFVLKPAVDEKPTPGKPNEEETKKGAENIWKILDPPTDVAVIEGNVKNKKGHKKDVQAKQEPLVLAENIPSLIETIDKKDIQVKPEPLAKIKPIKETEKLPLDQPLSIDTTETIELPLLQPILVKPVELKTTLKTDTDKILKPNEDPAKSSKKQTDKKKDVQVEKIPECPHNKTQYAAPSPAAIVADPKKQHDKLTELPKQETAKVDSNKSKIVPELTEVLEKPISEVSTSFLVKLDKAAANVEQVQTPIVKSDKPLLYLVNEPKIEKSSESEVKSTVKPEAETATTPKAKSTEKETTKNKEKINKTTEIKTDEKAKNKSSEKDNKKSATKATKPADPKDKTDVKTIPSGVDKSTPSISAVKPAISDLQNVTKPKSPEVVPTKSSIKPDKDAKIEETMPPTSPSRNEEKDSVKVTPKPVTVEVNISKETSEKSITKTNKPIEPSAAGSLESQPSIKEANDKTAVASSESASKKPEVIKSDVEKNKPLKANQPQSADVASSKKSEEIKTDTKKSSSQATKVNQPQAEPPLVDFAASKKAEKNKTDTKKAIQPQSEPPLVDFAASKKAEKNKTDTKKAIQPQSEPPLVDVAASKKSEIIKTDTEKNSSQAITVNQPKAEPALVEVLPTVTTNTPIDELKPHTANEPNTKKETKQKATKVKSKAPQPPRTEESPAPSEASSSSASTIVEVGSSSGSAVDENAPILSDSKNVQRSASVRSVDIAAVTSPSTESLQTNEKPSEAAVSVENTSGTKQAREVKNVSPTTNKRNKNETNFKQLNGDVAAKAQELPEKSAQQKLDLSPPSEVLLMDILEPKMVTGTKPGVVAGNVRVKTSTAQKKVVSVNKEQLAKDTGAIPKTVTTKENKVPAQPTTTPSVAIKKQGSPKPEVTPKPKVVEKAASPKRETPLKQRSPKPESKNPSPKPLANKSAPTNATKTSTKPAIPPRPNNLVSSPAQPQKASSASASSSNASTPSPNMYDDEEYIEYKFSPRPVFMSTICQTCKIPLQSFVHCKQCMMISYCTVEHLQEDEPSHQPLCAAIQEIAKKRGGHIYNNARILNDDDYRSLRVHTLNLCENSLKRHLQPFEREILLFPRLCSSGPCREWRQHLLTECKICGQVSYCAANPDHLTESHAKWCQAFALYQKLVVTQKHYGRIEPSLPSKIMSKEYQLTATIDETFRNLYKNYGAIKDECTYSALTQLATAPLTAYYGIQLAAQPIGDRFTIHLVGAELQFEADTLDKWETFFLHLVPQLVELRIVFVGPELNAENLPLEILSRIRMCRACRQNCRAVKFDFQCGTLYHSYVKGKSFSKPDLVCFFNPGLYRSTGFNGQDTWPDTIQAAISLNAPVLITSYTEVEAPRDLERLQKESGGRTLEILKPPHINPFASQRPERNFISDEVAPMIFKNFYCFVCK